MFFFFKIMHTEIKSNKKHIGGPRRQHSKLSGEN